MNLVHGQPCITFSEFLSQRIGSLECYLHVLTNASSAVCAVTHAIQYWALFSVWGFLLNITYIFIKEILPEILIISILLQLLRVWKWSSWPQRNKMPPSAILSTVLWRGSLANHRRCHITSDPQCTEDVILHD